MTMTNGHCIKLHARSPVHCQGSSKFIHQKIAACCNSVIVGHSLSNTSSQKILPHKNTSTQKYFHGCLSPSKNHNQLSSSSKQMYQYTFQPKMHSNVSNQKFNSTFSMQTAKNVQVHVLAKTLTVACSRE